MDQEFIQDCKREIVKVRVLAFLLGAGTVAGVWLGGEGIGRPLSLIFFIIAAIKLGDHYSRDAILSRCLNKKK